MSGWPRKFESMQDKAIAHRMKADIIATREAYGRMLGGTSPQVIALEVDKLQERGFQKEMPFELAKEINAEWVEDLEKYPEDLVKRACRNWRNGNNRYAPYAAGALMESVKDEFIERQTIFAKAGSVLEIVGDAA